MTTRLLAFQDRYNTAARPFDWNFTRTGLNALCQRIDARRAGAGLAAA